MRYQESRFSIRRPFRMYSLERPERSPSRRRPLSGLRHTRMNRLARFLRGDVRRIFTVPLRSTRLAKLREKPAPSPWRIDAGPYRPARRRALDAISNVSGGTAPRLPSDARGRFPSHSSASICQILASRNAHLGDDLVARAIRAAVRIVTRGRGRLLSRPSSCRRDRPTFSYRCPRLRRHLRGGSTRNPPCPGCRSRDAEPLRYVSVALDSPPV